MGAVARELVISDCGCIGGSLLPEGGRCRPISRSRIFDLRRLISTFCISIILELSLGSILASPVGGKTGLMLA